MILVRIQDPKLLERLSRRARSHNFCRRPCCGIPACCSQLYRGRDSLHDQVAQPAPHVLDCLGIHHWSSRVLSQGIPRISHFSQVLLRSQLR